MDNNKDEKILLTLKEAANYFGIGINTLRRLQINIPIYVFLMEIEE